MSKRRAVLLSVLLAGAAALAAVHPDLFRTWEDYQAARPLPGQNAISGVEVLRGKDGGWIARFDYYYTGEPAPETISVLQKMSRGPGTPVIDGYTSKVTPQRGRHRVNLQLPRHTEEALRITESLDITMGSLRTGIAQRMEWPDHATLEIGREFATNPPEKLLERASAQIDSGSPDQWRAARTFLQQMLQRNPALDQAYLELARIAMKENWNPEGLRQAEALIGSAMQIRPESPDAKILLGYVYIYQGRYRDSERLLVEASRSDTKNLWLWASWGDLLRLQGHPQEAVAKYREAAARPAVGGVSAKGVLYPNDHARLYAYGWLLHLLLEDKDLDGAEAVYEQRTAEYGAYTCLAMNHARFLLLERGDTERAEPLLRQGPERCPLTSKPYLRGVAAYLRWANAPESQRAEALRLARATAPVSATLLRALASSERVLPAAKLLLAAGEKIDVLDHTRFTALSYAVGENDLEAIRRLLALGANPRIPVGSEDIPVALLPVLSRDLAVIRLLQRHGVDYTQLRYRGMTAIDHARQIGDTKLLQLLDPGVGRL